MPHKYVKRLLIACNADSFSFIAVAENISVQLAEMISLLPERRVIASKNDVQDAVKLLTTRYALQPLLQKLVSLGEAGRDLWIVLRAT